MIPVITAQEMTRIERWAIERGTKGEALMREGGLKVATIVDEQENVRSVLLLIGKGNNGGDAYVAGLHLLEWGYEVRAFALYSDSECKPLNRKFGEKFARAGGRVEETLDVSDVDLIVDGIFGIGFQGKLEEQAVRAIRVANQSGKPIFAVDIPSGLDATTGEGPEAIRATQTIAMEFPKIGFFLRDGWNCLGKLRVEGVGFPAETLAEVKPVAWIPKLEELKLPPIVRNQHKYQRGFVLGFGGSEALKGAVKLTGLAALHAGAGIVKIFSLEELGATADELICQRWNAAAWKEALSKAQAVFVGPGLGRRDEVKQWLAQHLKEIAQPCVLDADALFFLNELAHWPAHALLTPHRGEMSRLLGGAEEETFLKECQKFVEEKHVLLVLKGAPTFVMARGKLPVIIPRGDPGMATAGSGDVLTGILVALLAQGKDLYDAAILGVVLHALAGEAAARAKTSYGYSASDLIAFLPEALHYFLHDNS